MAISLLLPDPFPRSYWILIYFVVVQMIESNVLGPRILGHAVGLHPVASILALVIGAQLFGPFGALLATPVVAALWVVIASLYTSVRGKPADTLLEKKPSPWIRLRKQPDSTVEDTVPVTSEHGIAADVTNAASNTVSQQAREMHSRGVVEPIDALRLVPNRDGPGDRSDAQEK